MGPLIFLVPAATSVGAILMKGGTRLMQPLQNLAQGAYSRVEPFIGSAIAVTTATSATKGALHMGGNLKDGDYEQAAITGAVTMVEMAGAKFIPVPLATGCALSAAGNAAASAGNEIFHANSAKTCEIVTHLPRQILPVSTAFAHEIETPSVPANTSNTIGYEPSVPIR